MSELLEATIDEREAAQVALNRYIIEREDLRAELAALRTEREALREALDKEHGAWVADPDCSVCILLARTDTGGAET